MARKKIALITGITGQDGSYLADFLLKKGYKVHGIIRDTSNILYPNIAHIQKSLEFHYADLLDASSITRVVKGLKPDEVYNLASQSIPATSFKQPIHTSQITGLGAHKVFDAVKEVYPKAKVYQASSSEMYGWVKEIPQNEKTPFNPANPYAAAKLYAHTIAIIYRKSYGLYISCGILFNHGSPRRDLHFVEQKVTYAAACVKLGIKNSKHLNEKGEPIVKNGKVAMGNLEAKRDFGFAGDYVETMWKMLQRKKPSDFVVGTGETHTIRQLCKAAFSYVGGNWRDYVIVDKNLIRPTETGPLVADFSKAKRILKWKPKIKFKDLVAMLIDENIKRLQGA